MTNTLSNMPEDYDAHDLLQRRWRNRGLCCVLFFKFWCHEDSGKEDSSGVEKRCKQTTKDNNWNGIFYSENIYGHINKHQPINFAQHAVWEKSSGITPSQLREFFEQSTVDDLFDKKSLVLRHTSVFIADKAIIKMIMQEFMLYVKCSNDDIGVEVNPPVDNTTVCGFQQ